MSVSGVEESGRRAERVQSERRAEEARAAEQSRRAVDENRQTRGASEAGRGENMDVTA